MTEVELQFIKDMALELVFAWQDYKSEEIRAVLERVMLNIGIDKTKDGFELSINGKIYHLGNLER